MPDPGRGQQHQREVIAPDSREPGAAVDDPGAYDSDAHVEAISGYLHGRKITREDVEEAVEKVKADEEEKRQRTEKIREVLRELHEATSPH